ncbi:MAG: Beta-lactamase domain protein [Parcubacteria group bacterium GW2011_GWD2_43_10]|nr:MAG: Beta-lactamase domain protein [Parcubacteria group bacterium GW2011_GWD2_43_10]HBZ36261.1 ribonuclease J [Candidatus Veblenbacteria bacterium]
MTTQFNKYQSRHRPSTPRFRNTMGMAPVTPANALHQPRSSNEQKLRIIPFGGQEEVGRNMTIFEYGHDIIVLDMGLQFPEEDMPGVDYIIPDIRYLKGKEKNIRGVILSHGHLDHIGAVPHLLPRLGWPTVYASRMTLALVRRRLEEAKLQRYLKAYEIKTANETLTLGKIKVGFFDVTHSIMDALGVVIQTPVANIVHPGDWRYDLNPVTGRPTDFSQLARWNSKTTPSVLMMESLGSTKEGSQISEIEIFRNIKGLLERAPGRVIIATFASMVERVGWLINISEQLGKKVALDGYSMKMNVEIAKKIGYLKFQKNTIIDVRKIHDYPDNKVVVVCTGAQGEDRAVLMRIATGEHKSIKLKKNDTIVFSSSVIPGNERTIQRLKDSLYRQCDHVVHKEIMDVHGGGHALIEDIKLLIRQVRPKYLLPVYANHYLLREAGKVASSIGFPPQNIFYLDNGSVAEITPAGFNPPQQKIPIEYVFVDGLGVGDVSHVVLRDRQMLAADGMVVVVMTIDGTSGKLVGSPDIISRGFVYMKDSKKLIEEARSRIKDILKSAEGKKLADETFIRDKVRNELGYFLFQKTERRPMILPVVIEV